jgi:nitrile hydratase accessory protein
LSASEAADKNRRPAEAPVFQEPWQAQAFALAVVLNRRGIFSWAEWSCALGATIQASGAHGEDGATYYQCWLTALERLVAEKRLVEADAVSSRKQAWSRAAHATPHGSPILLENDPLAQR